MADERGLNGMQAALLLAERVRGLARPGRPAFVGLNGAQGSGKSTMARMMAELLEREHGQSCAILSLDDFYLTRSEREILAAHVHPLCATRGVPGTHDVAMLRHTLDALADAGPDGLTPIPRFDKLADDREPRERWGEIRGRPDHVLLEGWCVDIRRADLAPWEGPINALEAAQDPRGQWFAWSLGALALYEPLWDMFDLVASIEVPDLETVIESRLLQELGMAAESDRPAMDRAGVVRFVQHYERYTCALWEAMRRRADLLLRRDEGFRFVLLR